MPILYNCKHSGDLYRITKFNSDMNVESSYLTDGTECDCPAGPRPTCRHRQMLPKFLQREHVGDEWFFDFDRGGWVQMADEWARYMVTATEPPEGVTMIVMDSPEKVVDVHNAIADAVGEPEAMLGTITPVTTYNYMEDGSVQVIEHKLDAKPPAATHIKRRF